MKFNTENLWNLLYILSSWVVILNEVLFFIHKKEALSLEKYIYMCMYVKICRFTDQPPKKASTKHSGHVSREMPRNWYFWGWNAHHFLATLPTSAQSFWEEGYHLSFARWLKNEKLKERELINATQFLTVLV